MTVTEKVAYLRGILDASELSEDAKETRIFKAIADVLDDLAMTVSDLEDGFSELSEQIDAVDEDLDASSRITTMMRTMRTRTTTSLSRSSAPTAATPSAWMKKRCWPER